MRLLRFSACTEYRVYGLPVKPRFWQDRDPAINESVTVMRVGRGDFVTKVPLKLHTAR